MVTWAQFTHLTSGDRPRGFHGKQQLATAVVGIRLTSVASPAARPRVRAVRAAGRLPPLTTQSAGSVCKRPDAVRLGRKKAARPPRAVNGPPTGAGSS